MILWICRWARRLDEWLQARLGRPYNALLGVGLVYEIVEQLGHIGTRLQSAPNLLRSLLILLVTFALLLHQVGALSHHIDRRRGGRTHPAVEE
jgi:hypothetical protein